jgi:DNA polymerase-3 subunit gamma/tau
MVAFALTVVDFTDDVLTLKFLSQKDLDSFKNASGASDALRACINDVLGVQVKFRAQVPEAAEQPAAATPAPAAPAVETKPIAVVEESAPEPEEVEPEAPAQEAPKSRNSKMVDESARYGESLLREMLGAEPIADKNGK